MKKAGTPECRPFCALVAVVCCVVRVHLVGVIVALRSVCRAVGVVLVCVVVDLPLCVSVP